ncbi:GNAT family N-acetyltransferase [Caenispirillum bisanense]|uniref:GNAT family N-acetyltransferase n=1 Tax=Caenispirillum bisanense TaxID=414052 RepID=UPI0031D6BA25
MALRVESLTGDAARALFDDLAALRIAVFREYPYLYAGSPEYERQYLAPYAASAGGVIIAAFDGARVIGAATALPLTDDTDNVAAPFRAAGIDPARVFYLGESVLLPEYRGRGLGHAFFDGREARARELGFAITAFCAVRRPPDHPRRPADYRPHDAFWRKRGYVPRPDMIATFSWQDIDEPAETEKPMVMWLRG